MQSSVIEVYDPYCCHGTTTTIKHGRMVLRQCRVICGPRHPSSTSTRVDFSSRSSKPETRDTTLFDAVLPAPHAMVTSLHLRTGDLTYTTVTPSEYDTYLRTVTTLLLCHRHTLSNSPFPYVLESYHTKRVRSVTSCPPCPPSLILTPYNREHEEQSFALIDTALSEQEQQTRRLHTYLLQAETDRQNTSRKLEHLAHQLSNVTILTLPVTLPSPGTPGAAAPPVGPV